MKLPDVVSPVNLPSLFAQVPIALLECETISPRAIIVWSRLYIRCMRRGSDGFVRASIDDLAYDFDMPRATLMRFDETTEGGRIS